MKKINVGIVGTGLAANNHYFSLKKLSFFKIKSICGNNEIRLNKRKLEWGLNCYNDLNKMIKNENLEVIVVCNENNLHYRSAKLAINAGCHVLVEKPIDTNINNAIKLLKLSQRKKKIVAVVMQKRFDKATKFLKKLIENKKFGKIIFARVDVFMHRDQSYYKKQKWISDPAKSGGGVTIHQSIHSLDQIIYILGNKLKKLSYWLSNSNRKMSIEDTAGGWIEFKDGTFLTINSTVCAYPLLKNRIEIYGEKYAVCLINDKIYKLPFDNKGSVRIIRSFKKKELGNYNDVWKSLAHKILNNKDIPNLIGSVLKTEKIIASLYNSARKRKIVNFD